MPKVFLDKLVTSAHLPRVEGSTGYCSTSVFPDLSHSMITTRFCPPQSRAMTPLGEMTKTYRAESFLRVRSVERPMSELKRKAKFFRKAHNVFANKVLLDLENMKLTRNKRRDAIWNKGKKDTGFEDLEDSIQNNMNGEKKSLDSFLLRGTSENVDGNNNEEDGGGGFDNFLYSDDFNPIEIEKPAFENANPYDADFDDFEVNTPTLSTRAPSSASKGFRPPNKTYGLSESSFSSSGERPSTSTVTAPGSTAFPSTDRAVHIQKETHEEETKLLSNDKNALNTTTVSAISKTGSQSTRRRKKKDSRRRKAFNQSTLFECLLDTMEIPAPHAPRFGMMSPSKTERDRTVTLSPSTLASPIKKMNTEEMTVTTAVASMNEDKWDTHSVERAMTGDKPSRPKRYY